MFEQEIELEKRSSWGPLLLVLVLVGAIAGGIGYYFYQMKKGLPQDVAANVISTQLKSKTATVGFRVGKVTSNISEQPRDPHYRLLEKAGYLKIKNVGWQDIISSLTPLGEKEFSSAKNWKNPDKTTSYEIPLATRRLVKIDSINMLGPTNAKVEYEWQWQTTKIGDLFDASGDMMKSFNTWDRQKLIDKYGADFYHTPAKKEVVMMVKDDKAGWKFAE